MKGTGNLSLAPSHLPAVNQSLQKSVDDFETILTDEQRQILGLMKDIPDADAILVFTAGLDSINRQRHSRSPSTRFHSFLSSVGGFCTKLTLGKPCHVADTFVSSNPEIAALVWGSMKLAKTASTVIVNFMSYRDGAFELMRITELCPVVSEYRVLYPESKSLSDFYASVIHCCKRLVEETQRGGVVQFVTKLITSIDEKFGPDLERVQRHRKFVKEQVSLAKYQADLGYKSFAGIQVSTTLGKYQNIRVKGKIKIERRQRLLDSLSKHDFLRPFKQSNENRYGSTTNWVFKTPQFQR
ncbi:hypothetical protein PspLS_03930 [Pyricularia sp. CBS 133598]|nr:hypothetical protein PspLS_03930 [Pyricularia sp. CBS 133598]